MGKRKNVSVSDDEEPTASESASDEKPTKAKARAKKPQAKIAAKKPYIPSDDDEEEERSPKKKKVEKPASSKRSSKATDTEPGALLADPSGDKYIDLGKKRRATIRSFKGTTYLDIREFYEAAGEEKPGKKGISLSIDQWTALKSNIDVIDRLFKNANK